MNLLTSAIRYIVLRFFRDKYGRKDYETFKLFLDDEKSWSTTTNKDHDIIYYYNKHRDFEMVIESEGHPLEQKWSKAFPDKEHDTVTNVSLRISGHEIKTFQFMHLDGFRYFLPYPEILPTTNDLDSETYMCWNKNSDYWKVFKIAGKEHFNIEEIAPMLKIEIVE